MELKNRVTSDKISHGYYLVLVIIVVAGALVLRLPRLSMRPMHTDEAVHADKFKRLLEDNYYIYNPNEYHGPVLNYITLIPAFIRGQSYYVDIDEFTLRIVPVFCGVLLILLTVLISDAISRSAVIIVMLLTAVSPAMSYYSRYYIQETMLGLRETAASFGLPFGESTFIYNTRLAQELGLWAESKNEGDKFHMAAFKAYFVDCKNLAESPVLVELASSIGLPADEASEILVTRAFKDAVDADWELSRTPP